MCVHVCVSPLSQSVCMCMCVSVYVCVLCWCLCADMHVLCVCVCIYLFVTIVVTLTYLYDSYPVTEGSNSCSKSAYARRFEDPTRTMIRRSGSIRTLQTRWWLSVTPWFLMYVSVRDTTYYVDFTFLIVRLSWFQFQISFSNILDFSEFSENFWIILKTLRSRYRPIPKSALRFLVHK